MEDSSPWADPSPPPTKQSSFPNDTDIWGMPSAVAPVSPVPLIQRRVEDATEGMEDTKLDGEVDKQPFEEDHSLREEKGFLEEVSVIAPPHQEEAEDNHFDQRRFDSTAGGFEDDEGFGDDDFAAAASPTFPAADDDFGDFGDFDDGGGSFEEVVVDEGAGGRRAFVDEPDDIGRGASGVRGLHLDPLPSRRELVEQIQSLMSLIFDSSSEEVLTDEPIRQVEGINQILTTESSRDTYAQLTTPPIFKPLDWTRSRARREHLVALGIPVNLDEVESHHLRALPPLSITTTSSSVKRGQSLDSHTFARNGNAAAGPSRLRAEPRERSKTKDERSLGERPDWNRVKAERLLEYREDQLSLVPPKYLKRMQEDLVEACSNASSLLAWLRQLEEIRKDDNKRKNEQIAELISRAQRLKASEASNSGGGLFRKGSQKRNSGSGYNTPHRTGSPAVR